MTMVEFTQDEKQFLLAVLENIPITGTPGQVRETLRMIDIVTAKIKAAGSDIPAKEQS